MWEAEGTYRISLDVPLIMNEQGVRKIMMDIMKDIAKTFEVTNIKPN
jgi:hypothetical protein